MQTITRFEDFDHGARGHVVPGLLTHGLVHVGVERLVQSVHGGDAEAFEDIEQVRLHQGHSLDKRALLSLMPSGVQGPLQIVEDREELAGEAGKSVTALFGQLALGPLPVVLEISLGPLEEGEVVIPLLLGDRDAALERLQVVEDGRRRLGFRL